MNPSNGKRWKLTVAIGLSATLYQGYRAYTSRQESRTKLEESFMFNHFENLNNQDCQKLEELRGCEDAVVDHDSGLFYYSCTELAARGRWFPPWQWFNATAVEFSTPSSSPGYISLYNPSENTFQRLELIGLPPDSKGLTGTHGIDGYVDRTFSPPIITLFVINHRPPPDIERVRKIGADSVIEVFASPLGSSSLQYITTIRDPETIITPNGLSVIDRKGFYVTNDHSSRTTWWKRHWLNPFGSSVVWCGEKETTGEWECRKVIEGIPLPNGIAKSPDGLVYVSSTENGKVYVYTMENDHSLTFQQSVKTERALDNVFVTPSGTVILAALPSASKLMALALANLNSTHYVAPTEIFQLSRIDDVYSVQKIFADDGEKVSMATNAIVFDGELFTAAVCGVAARCRLPESVLW